MEKKFTYSEDELRKLISEYTNDIVYNVETKDIGNNEYGEGWVSYYIVDERSIYLQMELFFKKLFDGKNI